MAIEIKKVKVLSKYQIVVKYEETIPPTEDGKSAVLCEIEATLRHEVHQDLMDALEAIKPHLIEMCGQPEIGQYEINQVVWGGDGEYRGVTLCGNRTLIANRKLNLNSPFCTFNEDVAWYGAWVDLEIATAKFEAEVIEYINGKFAPSKQMELEFDSVTIECNGKSATLTADFAQKSDKAVYTPTIKED